MECASTDLHVVRLHDDATSLRPELLQKQNQILKCRSGHGSYQLNLPGNSRHRMLSEAEG